MEELEWGCVKYQYGAPSRDVSVMLQPTATPYSLRLTQEYSVQLNVPKKSNIISSPIVQIVLRLHLFS